MPIDPAMVYRDQMILATIGTRPAILTQTTNTALLNNLARRLADAEVALAQLRAKGYGRAGQTLVEIVDALPVLEQACR